MDVDGRKKQRYCSELNWHTVAERHKDRVSGRVVSGGELGMNTEDSCQNAL